jgi:hypothetical protein
MTIYIYVYVYIYMYYFDLSTLFRERCYEIYTAFQRPPLCIALASLALAQASGCSIETSREIMSWSLGVPQL